MVLYFIVNYGVYVNVNLMGLIYFNCYDVMVMCIGVFFGSIVFQILQVYMIKNILLIINNVLGGLKKE